jgi:hypothetical protein
MHKEEVNQTVNEIKNIRVLEIKARKSARAINNTHNKCTPFKSVPTKVGKRVVKADTYKNDCLDIDNMSYEQLLALEEKVGKVSKGLNEIQIEV